MNHYRFLQVEWRGDVCCVRLRKPRLEESIQQMAWRPFYLKLLSRVSFGENLAQVTLRLQAFWP